MKKKLILHGVLISSVLSVFLLWIAASSVSVRAAQRQVVWPAIRATAAYAGFSRPIHVASAGDGSGRLFVVEQAGTIRLVKAGIVLGTPFLDITHEVKSPANGGGNEQGLLSVAFSPRFGVDRHLFLYYTGLDGSNRVARFTVSGDPDRADVASEKTILVMAHPTYTNHNGGQLAFGPDGYLYIGTGDGGGSGDPSGHAQNPASLLGKVLRIDVADNPAPPTSGMFRYYLPTITGGSGLAYGIPHTNPFRTTAGYRPEIWALGLRNPWRFSFDSVNGDLYIGDVGQSAWEEVDVQPASSSGGENYGWKIMEGAHCYGSTGCAVAGLTLPVAEYSHSTGCSITGGWVYRGTIYPVLQGIYLYADYCTGMIFGMTLEGGIWKTQPLLDTPFNISSFGADQDGTIYVTGLNTGIVYRIGSSNILSVKWSAHSGDNG